MEVRVVHHAELCGSLASHEASTCCSTRIEVVDFVRENYHLPVHEKWECERGPRPISSFVYLQ